MAIWGPIGSEYVPVKNLPPWVIDLLNGLIIAHFCAFLFFVIMLTKSFMQTSQEDVDKDMKNIAELNKKPENKKNK